MTNLPDIMAYVIDNLDLKIIVKSIAAPKVFVCDTTKHLTIGKIVEDENGKKYEVTDLDFNVSVDLVPSGHTDPFAGECIIGHEPLLLHGTPISTNNEYLQIDSRSKRKTPLVWILEPYEGDELASDSSLDASFDVQMFLLEWCNLPKWKNREHNDLAVKPMQNLADMIKDFINDDFAFKRMFYRIRKPRSRFGVDIVNKGNKRKIINEDFSGMQLRFNLGVYDAEVCTCGTN